MHPTEKHRWCNPSSCLHGLLEALKHFYSPIHSLDNDALLVDCHIVILLDLGQRLTFVLLHWGEEARLVLVLISRVHEKILVWQGFWK